MRLAGFQGRDANHDSIKSLDGFSSENLEIRQSAMPRDDFNHADEKTNIFAPGFAIYLTMAGHEPFSDLISQNEC